MTAWRGAALVFCAVAALLAWRIVDRANASPGELRAKAASHEAGRKIYNFRCYYCHGYSGDARTLAATMLRPKPLDFTRARRLTREHAIEAIRDGRRGTAMQSFRSVLGDRDIERVANFVLTEFVERGAPNTRYHTPENGWPGHERYAAAYPFATGEIALDAPVGDLTTAERAGRRLYLDTCISCHDAGRIRRRGAPWAVSASGRE